MFNQFEDVIDNKYLFTEEEYNVLKEPAIYSNNMSDDIKEPRQRLRDKILAVCLEVEQELHDSNIDLHTHWSDRNKVSLIYPCPRNYNKVDWVGVRFGRSGTEIKKLNELLNIDSNNDNDYGFLKFQNIQVNVRPYGLEIGLYHSIPQNTFDLGYTIENIDNEEFKTNIIQCIKDLQGLGFVWYCSDSEPFDLDEHKPEEFIQYYKSNSIYNRYSACSVRIPKWRIDLYKDNLIDTIEFYIEKLLPLYNLTKWYIKS